MTQRRITYFIPDGTYGPAKGLVFIDTTDWTAQDWKDVDNQFSDVYQEAIQKEIHQQQTRRTKA